MRRSEFEYDKKRRKQAIRFFPRFFGKDLCIIKGKSLTELYEDYQEILNLLRSSREKDNLYDAYTYLTITIKKEEETPELTSQIGKELYNRYINLITSITEYKFETKRSNTHGEKQNRINREILFELAFLRKYIVKSIVIIDDYFRIQEGKEVKSLMDNNIRTFVKEINMCLIRAKNILDDRKIRYHDLLITKHLVARESLNERFKALGETRDLWRKERNNACHTILDFYSYITVIANMAYYEMYGRQRNTLYELYGSSIQPTGEDLEFIKKGPNYYNYLSRDQIFNAIECGIRKRRLKSRKKKNED